MDINAPPTINAELLEQNPVLALLLTAFSLLILAFLAGSLISWILIGVRIKHGLPLLPVAPWTPRVWGLVDIVVTGATVVACQVVFARLGAFALGLDLRQVDQEHVPLALMTIVNAGNLVAVGMVVGWVCLRYTVHPSHVGFNIARLPRHIIVGVVAGLAVLPLVYLMMAAVNLGFKTQYNHPLLEEMKASATIVSYLLGVLTAAVVAPVVEEFLFRVLIQGWLQSIPFRSLGASLMGATQTEQPVPVATNNYEEPLAVTSLAPAEADEALTNNGLDQRPADEAGFSQKTVPPWWPAIATGILFGLAHWGYGLSFLPLIVLGIFLGLLYRATQSIWPCIIVHCMLNSSSMLALGIALLTDHVSQ